MTTGTITLIIIIIIISLQYPSVRYTIRARVGTQRSHLEQDSRVSDKKKLCLCWTGGDSRSKKHTSSPVQQQTRTLWRHCSSSTTTYITWQYYKQVSANAVVTCQIKLFKNYFSLHRRGSEIILFRGVETCLKLFHRFIAAHENFPTCSLSPK